MSPPRPASPRHAEAVVCAACLWAFNTPAPLGKHVLSRLSPVITALLAAWLVTTDVLSAIKVYRPFLPASDDV